jgi:small-conductance mechanosensitive channel
VKFIENLKKIVGTHVSDYERLATDSSLPGVHESARQHVAELKATVGLLESAESVVEIIPNAVEQLLGRLEPRRAMIGDELRLAWKKYYLSPHHGRNLLSTEAWKMMAVVLKNWAEFSAYWLIPYKMNADVITSVLARCAMLSAAMLVAFLAILMRLRRRRPSLSAVRHFLPFCLYTALGLPLMVAGATTVVPSLSTVTFLAEIVLAAGLVSLGWNLRRLSADDRASYKHNPLWQYWVIFAAGVLVQLFHFNVFAYSPLIAFLFIVAGVYSHVLRRRDQHVLDKRLLTITAWLSYVLAAGTIFGWGSLCALAAVVWFAVMLNIQLAAGLTGCLRKIRSVTDYDRTAAGRLAEGALFPMVFLGLFAVTILWVTLFIGGMPLVARIIQWHLIIGYLSLNLSMIVVIVAILFVTRSFIVVVNAIITFVATRLGVATGAGVLTSLHVISTYVIWSLYVLLSLKLIGVSVAHLAIVAGGLSIGAGFGLQDMIKNFFSGLVLLFGRSLHPGDEIQLGDVRGTVIRINIRNTVVQTNDDSTIFIPNSDLMYKNIVNWTYRDPRGRAEISVGVAYGSDTEVVRGLLVGCALSHPNVLREPEPYVLFWDFGDSALVFRLRFWIRRPVQMRDKISSAIRFEIDRVFRENGIEIAFPQQDIHIRSADGLNSRPAPEKEPGV